MSSATVRAVLYARVSSEEQRENTSLDDQISRCRQEADRRGWSVVGEYREDYTGTLQDRPRWNEVLTACGNDEADVVVVLKWDRIARSAAVGLKIAESLEDVAASILVVEADFDTSTITGKMLRNMMLAFAEFDRDQIVERMARGQHAMAAKNLWPSGGASPFGYRATGGRTNTLIVFDPEAQVLRDVADWMTRDRLTTGEVCTRLNAAGRLTRKGRLWTHQNLRRMLTQRTLVGEVTWANTEKTHRSYVPSGKYGPPVVLHFDPILDERTFEQLQDVLAVRATGKQTAKSDYPLSGLVTSPCGARYGGTRRADRNLRQYVCRRRRWTATGEPRCQDQRLDAHELERRVWDAVVDLLGNRQRILTLAQDYLALRGPELSVQETEAAAVFDQVRQLERGLRTLLVDLAAQGYPGEDIDAAAGQLRERLAAARARRDQIASWREQGDREAQRVRSLWELADTAHARLQAMSPAERGEVLRLLDVRVTVLGGGACPDIRIEGRLCQNSLSDPVGEHTVAGTPPGGPRRPGCGPGASAGPRRPAVAAGSRHSPRGWAGGSAWPRRPAGGGRARTPPRR